MGQTHFHLDNTPVQNSVLIKDYLTNMGIKTIPHSPYSPDLALCDFWLFPLLIVCRYETTEEMNEAVTNVIDTLTQEDFHGAFGKLLERYNKCIAAGGDHFEVMCVQSIKVRIRQKSGNLSYAPRNLNLDSFCQKLKTWVKGGEKWWAILSVKCLESKISAQTANIKLKVSWVDVS